MSLLIGIDVGTTNTKVRLYDERGRVQAEDSFHTPTQKDQLGELYNPGEIFAQIASAINRFQSDLRKQVKAVSVSSFAETMVGIDAGGNPVVSSLPWFDLRTEGVFQKLKETIDEQLVYYTTGLSPQSKYSFYKLFWSRENEPQAFAQVKSWTSMSGFILFSFTGVMSFDYSLASRTMFFDQRRRRWWDELLSLIGLSSDKLAPLFPSGVSLGPLRGEVAERCGLPREVVAVTGGHDHLCAALAAGVFQKGQALISSGTTESLTMGLDEFPPLEFSLQEESPFSWGRHVVSPSFYAMNGIYSGGFSIDWLMGIIKRDYAFFTNLSPVNKSDFPLFFPYLLGSSYPQAKGVFLNLDGSVGEEELTEGVVAGLCFEYGRLWQKMEKALGVSIERTVNVGGGTNNAYWMRMKASVLRREIVVPEDREGSSKGAALLAGIGSGVYTDAEEAFRTTFRPEQIFIPDNRLWEKLAKYFRAYVELEGDIKKLNQKLNYFLKEVPAENHGK